MTSEVESLLAALVPGIQDALPGSLVGIYLRGSLALGDFDPVRSDIDFLAVSEWPVSEREFAALSHPHDQISKRFPRYDNRIEASYIDRGSLKAFLPGQRLHPSIGVDSAFARREHRASWIIERWIVRERAVVLCGTDPKGLIDPISPDDLRGAARSELIVRRDDWATTDSPPDWLLPRAAQAYEVITICRALVTIANGSVPTKPQALAWAQQTLPEPWRSFVTQSQTWWRDGSPDPTTVQEVRAFVRWSIDQSILNDQDSY